MPFPINISATSGDTAKTITFGVFDPLEEIEAYTLFTGDFNGLDEITYYNLGSSGLVSHTYTREGVYQAHIEADYGEGGTLDSGNNPITITNFDVVLTPTQNGTRVKIDRSPGSERYAFVQVGDPAAMWVPGTFIEVVRTNCPVFFEPFNNTVTLNALSNGKTGLDAGEHGRVVYVSPGVWDLEVFPAINLPGVPSQVLSRGATASEFSKAPIYWEDDFGDIRITVGNPSTQYASIITGATTGPVPSITDGFATSLDIRAGNGIYNALDIGNERRDGGYLNLTSGSGEGEGASAGDITITMGTAPHDPAAVPPYQRRGGSLQINPGLVTNHPEQNGYVAILGETGEGDYNTFFYNKQIGFGNAVGNADFGGPAKVIKTTADDGCYWDLQRSGNLIVEFVGFGDPDTFEFDSYRNTQAYFRMQNTTAKFFVVPDDATYASELGATYFVGKVSTGNVIIAPAPGVTILAEGGRNTITTQYKKARLIKIDPDVWELDNCDTTTAGPTASFTFSPSTGNAPLIVNFTNTSTGADLSYLWNFGDGSPTSVLQNPVHTFTTANTFNVSLTVTNLLGSDNDTQQIVVTPAIPAPVASFTRAPASGEVPLEVTFTDTSTGSGLSWTWDFGDGNPVDNTQNPVHIYAGTGTFTATLTVTNGGGSDTTTQQVVVTAPPPPVFTSLFELHNANSSYGPPAYTTAMLADISTGTEVNNVWDNNTGIPLFGQRPDPWNVTLQDPDGFNVDSTFHVAQGLGVTGNVWWYTEMTVVSNGLADTASPWVGYSDGAPDPNVAYGGLNSVVLRKSGTGLQLLVNGGIVETFASPSIADGTRMGMAFNSSTLEVRFFRGGVRVVTASPVFGAALGGRFMAGTVPV